ncbi:MAG: extracellular solute-binding protein [Candidatus Hydrogenedentes bacterium]|nr:extracellular solute-binding protein [Candidatus Hydrogenedentota bacterium]
MYKLTKFIKLGSLTLVGVLGVWLLRPPVDEAAVRKTEHGEKPADVRFNILFSPGWAYLPGSTPFGIGTPLKGLTGAIAEFEARFPDTHIEVVNTPGVREYLVTQLSSGRAPDIINVNVEDVWIDVQKGWYVALDPWLDEPNRFIREQGDPTQPGYDHWWDMFRYQAISRGKAAPDGLMYNLSYDMIETGIFYNKRIFEKVGVRVPANWEEFFAVMEKLQAAGYMPLLMSVDMFSDWGVDLVFDQLYYNLLPGIDLFKDPIREPYLQGYLDWDEICFLHDRGFFTRDDPRYVELWQHLRRLRKYVNKNLISTDLVREFVIKRAAMAWYASPLVYRLEADRALGFEWGVFYVPQFTATTSRFTSNTPMCVIGGAATQFEVTNSAFKDTGDPKTSPRLRRVMEFLQFLCVPEYYVRIVNEYPCLISNIVGVQSLPPLKPFAEILDRRYTTTKWVFTFDLRFSEIQRRMLELYLNDGIGLEGFLDWQERNLAAACANVVLRKGIDEARLRAAWDAQSAARAMMMELPDGAG